MCCTCWVSWLYLFWVSGEWMKVVDEGDGGGGDGREQGHRVCIGEAFCGTWSECGANC